MRQLASEFGNLTFNADVGQRDGTLIFREGGGLTYVGTIDTTTGGMSLQIPSTQLLCSDPTTFGGTAAPDSETYSGSGAAIAQTPHACVPFSYTEQGSRCGGGTIDPGEGCDDGNRASGDGCSDSCQVEQCFTCTGEPSSCTPAPSSLPCDDGNSCTVNDTCNSGTCVGTPQPPSTPCDDANACTSDDACSGGVCVGTPVSCPLCSACDATGTCVGAPRTDCVDSLEPSKSLLQISDKMPDTKDRLRWRWRKGIATAPAALGDPLSTTAVATCLYDESSATPALLFRAVIPPGGTCDGKPCWKAIAKGGVKFKSKTGADGIVALTLRPGATGDPKADVKGVGTGLSGRPFGLPPPPFALPLRMQVQVEGGACFEAAHGAPGVITNVPGSFKGRGTP